MNTHDILRQEEYDTQLFDFLSAREGFVDLGVYVDSLGILTFGYGLAAVADARGKSNGAQLQYAKGIFAELSEHHIEKIEDRSAAATYWQLFYDALNDTDKINAFRALPKATNDDIARIFGNISMDTIQAKTLYDRVIQDYEKCVDKMFPIVYPLGMLRSKERIALVSLSYNRGEYSLIKKSPDLLSALQTNNRFEVWWQMLFNQAGTNSMSNRETFIGIINRRIEEANMFGLYDEYDENNNPTSIDEVRHIIQQLKDKLNNTSTHGLMNQYIGVNSLLASAVNSSIAAGLNLISQQVLNLASDSILNEEGDIKDKFNKMLSKITKSFLKLGADNQIDLDNSTIFNIFIREGLGTGTEYYHTEGAASTYATDIIGTQKGDLIIGASGLENIDGGDGDDVIIANLKITNSLNINGGKGNDFIIGTSYGATIDGGDGDDTIIGIGGVNNINGGMGKDTIYGGKGLDMINGGDGNDIIHGGDGVDVLNGNDGDDEIYGDEGIDNIDGGIGDDKIYGGIGDDIIDGGVGNDTLYGGDDSDVIFGNSGDDKIYGDEGSDYITGGIGDDYLYGGNGDDNLYGGKGDDHVYGDNGDDTIYGEDGHDFLMGKNGNDTLYGESGSDKIYGGYGDDTLVGGSISFKIDDDESDLLSGGNGNDTYVAGNGDRIIDSDGKGSVLFNGTSVSVKVKQQENGKYEDNGYSYSLNGNILTITEISTNKSISIESQNNAGDGDDDKIIYNSLGIILEKYQKPSCSCGCGCEGECGCGDSGGGGGSSGGGDSSGGSSSGGSSGGSTVVPGGGDGTGETEVPDPESGSGSETGSGSSGGSSSGGCDDGNCTCNPDPEDPDGGTGGKDNGKPHQSPIILNLDGVLGNDTILLENSDTYFDIKNKGFSNRTGWASSTDGLLAWDRDGNGNIDSQSELFGNSKEFANGFDMLRHYFDSNRDNKITDTDINFDQIKIWIDKNSDGISSTDELFSLNDLGIKSINLNYNRLNGTSDGSSIASSTFEWADGTKSEINDYLFGFDNGDAKYDSVDISDEIKQLIPNFNGFGIFKDLHVAMAEDKDLYHFVKNNMQSITDINNNFDTFMMKWSGLEKKHKELGVETNGVMRHVDMVWMLSHRSGQLERTDAELKAGNVSGCFPVDSNKAIYQDIKSRYLQISNIVLNFDGVFYSAKHDRVVISDAKKFIISMLSQMNTLEYYILLSSSSHFYNLKSSGAYDILDSFNVQLEKTEIYFGKEGNDNINGSSGNNIYVFNRGDGQDTIGDSAGDKDRIIFGEGITKDDLCARFDGTSLVIGIREEGKTFEQLSDKITINNFIIYSNAKHGSGMIEFIELADGTILDTEDIASILGTDGDDSITWYGSKLEMNAGDGDDNIRSADFDDIIAGGKGNDNISCGSGDDLLIGGKGNDSLSGGAGNDTYVFNRGDGKDTISDSAGDSDRILFGEGITKKDLCARLYGSSLIIGIREEGKTFEQLSDKITISNMLNSNAQHGIGMIEFIELADGTILDTEGIASILGTDVDDSITWYGNKLDVNMDDGNDTVQSGAFDDILAGGKGNDSLNGGAGNDTYVFNRGDGKDTINESSGDGDWILFGDINVSDIGLFKSGSTLQLSYGADDTISINSGTIERFEFADGGYLTDSDVNYIIQQMTAFSKDNGVNFTNANDVRLNEQFSQIVTSHLRHDF